jgi:LCP family protein required for cell wall assembly
MLLRSLLAGALIVLLTAGATATAGLLEIDDLRPKPPEGGYLASPEPPPKPGRPQTLLLIGSDHRYEDKKEGNKPHSDTMMLVRLDADASATAVLSIPRDLKVLVPGYGTAKINDSYAEGGPALTVRTIKSLTGLKIHHVVNVNFGGFREAVDSLGCFYADIDRRYYHSNAGVPIGQRYDAIDIKPGYQQLCGAKALDYVRFRHADNDLVRAARQQDFLRAAKDQLSTSRLIDDRSRLAHIFSRASQTDRNLGSLSGFLRLMKLALYAADKPVRQIEFPATFTKAQSAEGEVDYVEASQPQIAAVVDKFLHGGGAQAKRRSTRGGRSKGTAPPLTLKQVVARADVVDARDRGESRVAQTRARDRRGLGIPLRFPRYLPEGQYVTSTRNPRIYTLRDRADRVHTAYRFTIVKNQLKGAYYGVQGTTWRTPPALAHPSATRRVGGRALELFRSGGRLRFVAWRTRNATYWISNTLTMDLRDDEMLAMAASLTSARKGR